MVGLSRVPVSQAYPLLSLGYVLNVGLAWWLLGEVPNAAARRRDRRNHRRRGPGGPVMNDSARDLPMLPFTRPEIDEETIAEVVEVLRSGWLATGPKVAQLEAELSDYCGGRPIRSQTSATAGLEMALLACGIGPGDEVITPAMSFVATANVIMRVGARPVFVDVGLDSRNIDLDQVEAAITPRTRALMPVHFAGLPVDMDRLYAIAARHKLRVIEDAAHAIGSSWRGRRIGSFGDLVCFSFHPNKNITTIEGGAISGGSPEELRASSCTAGTAR